MVVGVVNNILSLVTFALSGGLYVVSNGVVTCGALQ